jgi:hypothetical protein
VLQPGAKVLEGAIFAVEAADDPSSPVATTLRRTIEARENAEPTRFHIEGYRAMATVLFAIDQGATTREALTEVLRSRGGWAECAEVEQIRVLTIRDGELQSLDEAVGVSAPSESPSSGG